MKMMEFGHKYTMGKRWGRPKRCFPLFLAITAALILLFPAKTAQAAEAWELPEDPRSYTGKTANYNQEYEFLLHRTYDLLPALGTEPAQITVEGYCGSLDEILDFAKYIYEKYDYTKRVSLSYTETYAGSPLYEMNLYFDNPKQIYEMQKETEKKLLAFSKTLEGLPEQERVIRINNWLVSNAEYDYSLQNSSCYDNVILGASTCNGFASAFFAACSYSGIECENVLGYANNMLHMWNCVEINNEWKYIDVTWNEASASDRWLLLSREDMGKDHTKSRPE